MIRLILYTLLIILVPTIALKAQHIEILQQGRHTSIRGLSVVDNKVAWVSGSGGTVAITKDAGKTWDWLSVKGYEKADFRDIEAFSEKEAIIMSSGTPALILKTTDGGTTWQEKFRNNDTTYFFDAMDFAGKTHGLILGDPIGGRFLMMETKDGGEHWHVFKTLPTAQPGEAAFAASGTCLRMSKNKVSIVSGGSVAHILTLALPDTTWHIDPLPIMQGKASQGAFSIANDMVIVGGDYAKDKIQDWVSCYFVSELKDEFKSSELNPTGFQSCVEQLTNDNFISTGTSGSNISYNLGQYWNKIDEVSFNVCRKAKNGSLVLLAGDRGRIGIFKP